MRVATTIAVQRKYAGEEIMKSVQVSRRAFLKASKAVAAGLVLSPAIIGRAQAATLKLKCSSSLPNDPKYANGRVYYDNLVKQPEGQRARRADRGHLLSRQPARPGNRRHQFGQARGDRPDGVGLVDLGQSGSAGRHLRSRLSLHQLSSSRPRRSTPAPPSRSRTRCSRAPISGSSPGPIISARAACWRRSR